MLFGASDQNSFRPLGRVPVTWSELIGPVLSSQMFSPDRLEGWGEMSEPNRMGGS